MIGLRDHLNLPPFILMAPLAQVMANGSPAIKKNAAAVAMDVGDPCTIAEGALLDEDLPLRLQATFDRFALPCIDLLHFSPQSLLRS